MSSCCKPSQSCCAPTNNQGVIPTPSTSISTKLAEEENKQKDKSCCSTAPSGCCEQSSTNSDNLNLSKASANEVRSAVSHAYAARLAESVATNTTKAAAGSTGCCAPAACGGVDGAVEYSLMLGYSAEDVKDGGDSNFGLGCGNPTALAGLSEGEVVLDLGSGAGFDCFLAAKRVGVTGRVIGVDMTAEMIAKARENAEKRKATNVQFIQSTMESLPLANDSIDVILSNCVLNLSPEKSLVFSEAFRVLKPGGRLHIYDLIATKEIPQNIKNDLSMHCGCMAGATPKDQLQTMLQKTGFHKINIQEKQESKNFIAQWAPGSKVEEYIVSAYISAYKSK